MSKSFKIELFFKKAPSLELTVSADTKEAAVAIAKRDAKLMGWANPASKVKCVPVK